MRVLIIHNHYQDPGGEDVVFDQEAALLRDTLEVYTLTFQNRKGWKGLWQTLWSPWNSWAGRRVTHAIKRHNPTVIHIHNLHYAIGPIAIQIAKRHGIPVVMTLHNYRLLCPSATLFHDGGLFTKSLHAAFPWEAVRKGVHSRSSLKTFWLALTVWLHKKIGTWQQVDRYLVLTDFAKQLFLDSSLGVPGRKFTVKPNFVADHPILVEERGNHFLFIGRLAEEKGVETLLQAFTESTLTLRIAGDGPLKDTVLEHCRKNPNTTFLGAVDRQAVQVELAACSALIFPSIWYEGMPMTIIEAFATGTPVIASDLGAMKAMVNSDENGWLFPPGDAESLRRKAIAWTQYDDGDKTRLSRQARQYFEQYYTAAANKKKLLNVYQHLT